MNKMINTFIIEPWNGNFRKEVILLLTATAVTLCIIAIPFVSNAIVLPLLALNTMQYCMAIRE